MLDASHERTTIALQWIIAAKVVVGMRGAGIGVGLDRAGIRPEIGHCGVECFLPAAEDEDEGAFFDEALCRGAANSGSATGDHGGLPIQSVHGVHFSSELYKGSELLAEDLGSSPMKTID